MRQKPVMLLILDGWGYRKEITPDNAIEQGHTPNWHRCLKEYPHCLVQTSGLAVGLPEGQMGNSEVGHTNLGAGRVVMQDLPKIDLAIKDGSLKKNPVLLKPVSYTHLTLPTESAAGFVAEFEKDTAAMENVKIATVAGRFYAMDRDKRWDRVEKAYNNMVMADGKRFADAVEAIKASYAEKVSDEFVVPAVIGDYQGFEDGDAVLMANFRADRAREILYALADREFTGFERKKTIELSMAVGMTEYSVDHNRFMQTMFPPEALVHIFGEVVAENGLTQLRIAETEKYAHVTFFFNGGEEKEFAGESRILVPSPKVATYDLKPEMSVYEVTDHLVDAIEKQKFDVIICNFANGDMVGHTGIMEAALKAVAAVDECLGRVVKAIKDVDGALLVTADHGNAEKMVDEKTGQPYTAHTVGDVQAVLVNGPKDVAALNNGKLADISPTLLDLLGIKQPAEMTGKSLLVRK